MGTSKRKGTSKSSRRSVATTKEEKSQVEGSVKRTITTETVVRRHSIAGALNESAYEYVEDDWERSPKTDYTYSRSCTYLKSQNSNVTSPNMSRRRLHGETPVMSPIPALRLEDSPDSDISNFTSVSQRQSNSSMQPPVQSTPVSRPVRRRDMLAEGDSGSEVDEVLRSDIPPSCTRSGTQYGMKQWLARRNRRARRDQGSVIEDEFETDSQLRTESSRRLDYSLDAEEVDYRNDYRYRVPHLYGLDHYSDDSDAETTSTWRSSTVYSRPPTLSYRRRITSSITYIWTSILTIITTVCRTSWQLITYPVTSVVHLITKRQHEDTRYQSHVESHLTTSNSLSWWRRIIKAFSYVLTILILGPPIAIGEFCKRIIHGFYSWTQYRYESFKEYHEYETGQTYDVTQTVTTSSSQETKISNNEENEVAAEMEKTDQEKEYDDDTETKMSCCRDMLQTLFNVIFFLVVGFPILVGSLVLDTITGNKEGYGNEFYETGTGEVEETAEETITTTTKTTETVTTEEYEDSFFWKVMTAPFRLVYLVLVPAPRAVGHYVIDKLGCFKKWLSSLIIRDSESEDRTGESGDAQEVQSNGGSENMEETSVMETMDLEEDNNVIDSMLWSVITSPIWLLHFLFLTLPTVVGLFTLDAISSLFGGIFTRSDDGEIVIEETDKSSESKTTTKTTTTETFEDVEDPDDDTNSLLWTILSSPFLLLEWLFITLPIGVGRFAIACWNSVWGSYKTVKQKKRKSVHFADDVLGEDTTLSDNEDGYDTVDNSTAKVEATKTDKKGILWFIIALPVFLLYWTVIGIPLAVGRYVLRKLNGFRTWMFSADDGENVVVTEVSETVIKTSKKTDKSSVEVTEENSEDSLCRRLVLAPCRLLKWLLLFCISVPVGIGKSVKKVGNRAWTGVSAMFYSLGGTTAEVIEINRDIDATTKKTIKKTKVTKTTEAETRSIISRTSDVITKSAKFIFNLVWRPIYLILFVIPFGVVLTIVEGCRRLWRWMTSLFSARKSRDLDKDVDETEINRRSMGQILTSSISYITYPFVATGTYLTRGWLKGCQAVYKGFASVIVADTWLLSKTSAPRRKNGLCALLPLILLLPLVLVGLMYIFGCGSGGLFGLIPIPSFSSPFARSPVAMSPAGGCTSCPPPITDEQLTQKVQQIFAGLYKEKEAEAADLQSKNHETLVLQQQTLLTKHKEDVDGMVKDILQKEIGTLKAGVLAAAAAESKQDSGKLDESIALQQQAINLQMDQLKEQGKADLLAVQNELKTVNEKVQGVVGALATAKKDLESEDERVRQDSAALVAGLEAKLAGLKDHLSRLETAQLGLIAGVKDCCKNDSALALLVKAAVQEHMATLMAENQEGGNTILGAAGGASGSTETKPDPEADSTAFMTFLNNHNYAKHNDVEDRIAALTARLNEQIKSQSEAAAAAAVAAAATGTSDSSKSDTGAAGIGVAPVVDCSTCKGLFMLGNTTASQLTESQVKLLIKEALLIFGADRTGMVDYALESSGGSVLSTRCSETFHRRTAQISLFGIPLWYSSNSPRTVIQPDVQPGQCWAFKGTQGFLVIQLAGNVHPTAFSLEHIPKALSPTGKIDSAPKDFSVWGLEHEKDTEGVPLGNFTYRDDNEPIQVFPVADPTVGSFNIVELRILSNHGNQEYTCLYRFRVHGDLRRW